METGSKNSQLETNFGGSHLTKSRLVNFRFSIQWELTGDQAQILFEMVLARLESVLRQQVFSYDIYQNVKEKYLSQLHSLADRHPVWEESFFNDESMIIEEMFQDLEQDSRYAAQIYDLHLSPCLDYRITAVSESELKIMLYN